MDDSKPRDKRALSPLHCVLTSLALAGGISLVVGLKVVLSDPVTDDALGLGSPFGPLLFVTIFVVFMLYVWSLALVLTLVGCGAIPALRRRTCPLQATITMSS